MEKKIVHVGWADKEGQKIKNWKRRWFVLVNDGTLRYFENKSSFAEKGHVTIDKNTSISIRPSSSQGTPVSIINPNRNFLMSLSNKTEAEEWIQILQNVKNSLN